MNIPLHETCQDVTTCGDLAKGKRLWLCTSACPSPLQADQYAVVGRVLVARSMVTEVEGAPFPGAHGHVHIARTSDGDVVDVVVSRCARCDEAHEVGT